MKLFLVHCGYYDPSVADGATECHANFFVAAASFAEAKANAKALPAFKANRMHVDSMTQIEAVDGMRVELAVDERLAGKTKVHTVNGWARRYPDASSHA